MQPSSKPQALDKPSAPTASPHRPAPSRRGSLASYIPRSIPFVSKILDIGIGGGGYGLAALALAPLLVANAAHAQLQTPPPPAAKADRKSKTPAENIEWMWQYSPADKNDHEGRENELLQDQRFRPMIDRNFTAPQSFWGQPIVGRYRSLSSTVLDFLSIPDKVLADEDRYLTITGCVVHFCPSRGLLWVDLNGKQPLMVFAAIQWIQDSKPTTDPAAEYTLWLFPNQPLSASAETQARIPPALTRSIGRWSRQPMAGSHIVQNITHAILVEPDGTPHELLPDTLGITPPTPRP
jgi:hypothetical protein